MRALRIIFKRTNSLRARLFGADFLVQALAILRQLRPRRFFVVAWVSRLLRFAFRAPDVFLRSLKRRGDHLKRRVGVGHLETMHD